MSSIGYSGCVFCSIGKICAMYICTFTRSGNSTNIQDRKSTRLNSSHQIISYAVFCLKKKKAEKPLNKPAKFGALDANHAEQLFALGVEPMRVRDTAEEMDSEVLCSSMDALALDDITG